MHTERFLPGTISLAVIPLCKALNTCTSCSRYVPLPSILITGGKLADPSGCTLYKAKNELTSSCV